MSNASDCAPANAGSSSKKLQNGNAGEAQRPPAESLNASSNSATRRGGGQAANLGPNPFTKKRNMPFVAQYHKGRIVA